MVTVRSSPRKVFASADDAAPQFWSEFQSLFLPVAEQRCGHHKQIVTVRVAPAFQECQNLNGLTETHIIGKTTAESDGTHVCEPSRTDLLIAAQFSFERLRHIKSFRALSRKGLGESRDPIGVGDTDGILLAVESDRHRRDDGTRAGLRN